VQSDVSRLGRRFAYDFAITVAAAFVLGALWVLFYRATEPGRAFSEYDVYRPYVEATLGVVVGLLFMRAVGRLVSGYLRLKGDQRHETMVRLFFNILVAVLIVFYVASVAGVNLQSLFLGSALAGVVLGLASQTLLGNVFAGITIALWGPYRTGDRISVV
jgi:small-conductance mechanosensitive channel